MKTRATITGWGKCVPPVKLTNADLEEMVETNDQWIVERTGMQERGISHVEVTDLAEVAASRALAAAGLEPTDIDLLVLATVTPEITLPSNACFLQERIGATNAAAFDLNAACSGFVYSTAAAASMIEAGVAQRALVIGAEKLHYIMDYHDRNHCILFGDGAGAAVFEARTDGSGVLANDLGADGQAGQAMVAPTLGTRGGIDRPRDPSIDRMHFEGQTIFKHAVRGMEGSVRRTLDQAGLTVDDVDVVVPHQANLRIIEATCSRLGVPMDKVVLNIADHGNTSAASVPMALNDALVQGRIEPGSTVLFTAFGGGLTWGSNVMVWGDRVEPLATSDAELPPTDQSVFDLLDTNRNFFAPYHEAETGS
ncbi:MAG: beta-ketoacyl-ACP synthase III [Actinomycetota bacterium]